MTDSILRYSFFSQPSSLWEAVIALRMQVFVQEMKVPDELELDHYDADAIHLSVQDNKQTIGTLRLVRVEEKRQGTEKEKQESCRIKIGRFALHQAYRRQGIGTQMMNHVYHWCQQEAISNLYLDAQTYVVPFYQSLGFVKQGDIFMDAGIYHVRMQRSLTSIHYG